MAYTILNESLQVKGKLTLNNGQGSTAFFADTITQQLATDNSSDPTNSTAMAFNEYDKQGNAKQWGHSITVSVEATDLGSGISTNDYLMYFDDVNNHYYLMKVITAETDRNSGFVTISGINTAIYELGKQIINAETTFKQANLQTVVNGLYKNAPFSVVIQDDLATVIDYTVSANTSLQAVLQDLQTKYDVDVDSWIELDESGNISDRIIYFGHIGRDNGELIRYGGAKGFENINAQELSDTIYTKLYVTGLTADTDPTKGHIGSVNNGMEYIIDDDANGLQYAIGASQQQPVYLEGSISNTLLSEPQALLTWANAQMSIFNHPRFNYTVTPLHDQIVGIGDTIAVQDFHIKPEILVTSKVIQKSTSFASPETNTFVLGEFSSIFTENANKGAGVIQLIKKDVTVVQEAADYAKAQADEAHRQAVTAQEQAIHAQTSADGKTTTYTVDSVQDLPDNVVEGDIGWVKLSDGTHMYSYTDGEWVEKINPSMGADINKKVLDAVTQAKEHVEEVKQGLVNDIATAKSQATSQANAAVTQANAHTATAIEQNNASQQEVMDDIAKSQADLAIKDADFNNKAQAMADKALSDAKSEAASLFSTANSQAASLANTAQQNAIDVASKSLGTYLVRLSPGTNIFRTTNSTTIQAQVWKAGQDITSTLDNASFSWKLAKDGADAISLTNNVKNVTAKTSDFNSIGTYIVNVIIPVIDTTGTTRNQTFSDSTTIAKVADGVNGTDGQNGDTGNGISSTTITYAVSTSGTNAPTSGYTSTIPTVNKGQFLWQRTTTSYTNGTTKNSDVVTYFAKDGLNGIDGIDGGQGMIAQPSKPTSGLVDGFLWLDTSQTYPVYYIYDSSIKDFKIYQFNAKNINADQIKAKFVGTDRLSASQIIADDLRVKSANIDGQMTASQITVSSTNGLQTSLANFNLGEISQTISDTKSAVNNLSVGGRNLLLGTANAVTGVGTNSFNDNFNAQGGEYSLADGKKLSDLYNQYGSSGHLTISFDWVASGSTISGTFNSQWNNTPWGTLSNGSISPSNSNLSGHYEYTVSLGTNGFSTSAADAVAFRQDNLQGNITISNLKLESGNKATDWTPAPEDTAAAVSQVSQKVDSISSFVRDSSGNISSDFQTALSKTSIITGSTLATSIKTQTTSQISSALTDNNGKIISLINQDSSGVQIAGKNIILDGKVRITNEFTVGQANIANGAIGTAQIGDATINNAKIANLDASKISSGTIDTSRLNVGQIFAQGISTTNATIGQTLALSAGGKITAPLNGQVWDFTGNPYYYTNSTGGAPWFQVTQTGTFVIDTSGTLQFDGTITAPDVKIGNSVQTAFYTQTADGTLGGTNKLTTSMSFGLNGLRINQDDARGASYGSGGYAFVSGHGFYMGFDQVNPRFAVGSDGNVWTDRVTFSGGSSYQAIQGSAVNASSIHQEFFNNTYNLYMNSGSGYARIASQGGNGAKLYVNATDITTDYPLSSGNISLNTGHAIVSKDNGKMFFYGSNGNQIDLGVRSLTQSSLVSLKEHIGDINQEYALNETLKVDVKQYNFIGDDVNNRHVSPMIDDVNGKWYIPKDWVSEDGKSVDVYTITGYLIQSIKALQTQITELKRG